MKIKIEARLKAGIKFDEVTQGYVTYVPALRIYSQGDTTIVAKAALEDAVNSFLYVALKKNVLEKCLRDMGFSPVSPSDAISREGQANFINIKEAKILEENKFSDIFELPLVALDIMMEILDQLKMDNQTYFHLLDKVTKIEK